MYLIIEYEDDKVHVTIHREVVKAMFCKLSVTLCIKYQSFRIDFVCTSTCLICLLFLLGCQVLLESINVHSIKANCCTVARVMWFFIMNLYMHIELS